MKYIIVAMLAMAVTHASAQKTKTTTIIDLKGVVIHRFIIEQEEKRDTAFSMMARNAKYSTIVDVITIRLGSADDIYRLLEECLKMFPEEVNTQLHFEGNGMVKFSKSQLMLFGAGKDSRGYVLLTSPTVTKLLDAMRPYR